MPGPYKRVRTGAKGFRKRARTTGPYRRKKFMQRNISRIARAVVLRAAETKEKQFSVGKVELYHNSLSYVHQLNHLTVMPGKGDNEDQRNGDTIIARGWRMRMTLANKGDRPNVTYRIVVVARNADVTPGYGDVFKNTSGNCLLDMVDDDQNTKLYDKTYKPNRGMVGTTETGLREFVIPFKFWIPRKMTYKFTTNTVTNDRSIWMFVMAYDAYGTLVTDNIGYTQVWGEFLYKDP